MLPTPSLRIVVPFIALCAAACTLERGGAGLSNVIDVDGGVGGVGAQGGSSAGQAGSGGFSGNAGNAGSQASGGSGGTGGTSVGGSGGAAGAAAGGSSGGGAGGGSSEDCLDGKDNDLDGAIDCADTDCAAYECVEGAPTGWTGYFRLRDSDTYDPSAAKIDCEPGKPPTRFFTEPSPSACSACSCGGLTGAACGPVPLFCSNNRDCNGATDVSATMADGACHKIGSNGDGSCYLGTAPVAQPGSCTASGGEQTNPQPFQKMVDVCGFSLTAGQGCNSEVCVPRAPPDYAGFVCISQQGEHACPSGWGIQRIVSANGSDQRSCSGCTCTPSATCSGGAYRVYDYDGCGGGTTDLNATTCKDFSGLKDFANWGLKRTSGATASGSCAAAGGVAAGQVDLNGTQTFCCRP